MNNFSPSNISNMYILFLVCYVPCHLRSSEGFQLHPVHLYLMLHITHLPQNRV